MILHSDILEQESKLYYNLQEERMADRKVLIKYIPKNFDPKLLVKRGRGRDKLMMVRNMLPMSLRCNVCHNYLYIGTKFNMRMEICNEEDYLGIKIFRFYLKCTYCYNDICFKTDPKNHDYIVEDGATRNYEAMKDAEQASKLMKKMKKDEQEGSSMKFLQNKTYDSKRQMELMEALDDIKNLNKRNALIDPEDLLNHIFVQEEQERTFTQQEEKEIDEVFRQLRKKKLTQLQQSGMDVTQKLQEILQEEQQIQQKKAQSENISDNQGQVKAENMVKLQHKTEKESTVSQCLHQNPRLYAIQKGNLFNFEQQQKNPISSAKSKMPKKKKVIKKAQKQVVEEN